MDNDELQRFRQEWKAELVRLHAEENTKKATDVSESTFQADDESLTEKKDTDKKDNLSCIRRLCQNGSRIFQGSEQCGYFENINNVKKRKRSLNDTFSTKEKEKKEALRTKFSKGKSLIDQLISDIDEITTIPFFDQELPREIAVKIFMYLGVVDLCHCAQVNRTWKILAEDEFLWHNLAVRLGYINNKDMKTIHKSNWKTWVGECILRKCHLRKNWKERICSLTVLDFERGGSLAAVAISGDVICAGYSNGQVRFWEWNPEKPCGRILESQAGDGAVANNNQLTSLTVEDNICAAGFQNGNLKIWHTDLDNPLKQCLRMEGSVKSVAIVANMDKEISVFAVSDHQLRVHTASGLNDHEWNCYAQKTFGEKIEHVKLLCCHSGSPSVPIILASMDRILIHTPGQLVDTVILDHIIGGKFTCIDSSPDLLAVSVAPYGYCTLGNTVRLYCPRTERQVATLCGHTREITCLNLSDSPPNSLCTGSFDKHVRIYDLRTEKVVQLLRGHEAIVTTVQMNDHLSVSGSQNGTVRVWDLRMGSQLWSTNARHPVRICKFTDTRLITANIPSEKNLRQNVWWADDLILHRRHRGIIRVFDFNSDNISVGIPDICFSNYDDTSGYNYNINLAVPYDDIVDVYD